MKKGFTLLELVVVILIIGVLATLGLTQYSRMVEKARGAEARAILGDLRKLAAAHRMQYVALDDATYPFSDDAAGIDPAGTDPNMLPGICAPTHFFSYSLANVAADSLDLVATRCDSGGKTPDAPVGSGWSITLTSNFAGGGDSWGIVGPY